MPQMRGGRAGGGGHLPECRQLPDGEKKVFLPNIFTSFLIKYPSATKDPSR